MHYEFLILMYNRQCFRWFKHYLSEVRCINVADEPFEVIIKAINDKRKPCQTFRKILHMECEFNLSSLKLYWTTRIHRKLGSFYEFSKLCEVDMLKYESVNKVHKKRSM